MWVALGSLAVALGTGGAIFQLLAEGFRNLMQAFTQVLLILHIHATDTGSLYWLALQACETGLLPRRWFAARGPYWNLGPAVLMIATALGLAYLVRDANIAIIGSSSRNATLARQTQRAEERAQINLSQSEGALCAAEVECTRIERDLHDGVIPALRRGEPFTYLATTTDPLERTTNSVESINHQVKQVIKHHPGLSEDHLICAIEWVLCQCTEHPGPAPRAPQKLTGPRPTHPQTHQCTKP